jgi:hypothetical protein
LFIKEKPGMNQEKINIAEWGLHAAELNKLNAQPEMDPGMHLTGPHWFV